MGQFDDTGLAPADAPDRMLPNVGQFPTAGPLDSKLLNSTISRMFHELLTAQEQNADLLSRFKNIRSLLGQSSAWNTATARSLEEARERDRILSQLAHISDPTAPPSTYILDFRAARNVSYQLESLLAPGTFITYPLSRRVRIDFGTGNSILPYIDMTSLFHTANPADTTDPLFLDTDVQVKEITAEGAIEFSQTDPKFIFNAEPNQVWLVRAVYDLASGVTEATFDVTIQVPQQFAKEANMLRLMPAPEGRVDIVEVLYSSSTAVPDTALPDAVFPIQEMPAKSFHFAPTIMTSIKVRIRSRHWVEEANQKVFYLGLQDLDLQLIEHDNTFDDSVYGQALNNGFFEVIEIPKKVGVFDGTFFFDNITGIRVSPDVSTSDTPTETNNGIHIMLFTDPELQNPVWDSIGSLATGTTPTPAAPLSVASFDAEKLYLVVELDKLTSGKSPVFEEIEIDYKVKV